MPQLSIKENILKLKPKYFSSGPKIFDYLIPLIGKEGELLISPFLGHVGVCTILEQILIQSKLDVKVYFFGTCGGYRRNEIEVGSIVHPDSFYIEEKLEFIEHVNGSDSDLSILSTSFLSQESTSKLKSLHTEHGIKLIDMEASFIKRICLQEDKPLIAKLIVTDIWDESTHAVSPMAIKSLPKYTDFLDLLLSSFL